MYCLCDQCGAKCAMIYREELQVKPGEDWATRQSWYFWQCMYCDATGARILENVEVNEDLFGSPD